MSSAAATAGLDPGLAAMKWIELRREAVRLESQIDGMIVSLGRASGNLTSGSQLTEIEGLEGDTRALLDKLTAINNLLSDRLNLDPNASPMMKHYTSRHQSILSDYRAEFDKTRGNIRRQRDRKELLSSVREDINAYRQSGQDKTADLYLKEHEHIQNSDRLTDQTLGIASSAKEALLSQRQSLRSIGSRLQGAAQRFPIVNNLVQKINLRKRRDAVILAMIIAGCIIFSLWYMIR